MIAVSNDFKLAMKQPVKELDAYIKIDNNNQLTSADDLISFKISCDTGMCKTAMRKLEAKYLGEHNLLGQWVHVGFGVKLPNGTFEYLDYGSFLITEITYTKDTGITNIVGYDKMINSMKEYRKLNVEYPIDLYTYTKNLCFACGLELGNESFSKPKHTELPYINCNETIFDTNIEPNNTTEMEIKLQFTKNSQYIMGAMSTTSSNRFDIQYTSSNNLQFGLGSGTIKYTDSSFSNDNIPHTIKVSAITKELIIDNNVMATSTNNFTNSAGTIYLLGVHTPTLDTTHRFVGKFFNSKVWKNGELVANYVPVKLINNRLAIYDKISKIYLYPIVGTLSEGDYQIEDINNWQINQELWENINGITYRDILVQIAQVTASTCIISNDDKVYFKPLTNTNEQLTYDNMLKLKLEPKYGEINSVVLSRTPQEDNIYMRDEDSININGLTEYKIENNEIIDKDRDNAITPIYNQLHGIDYYPFETSTEGLGWFEIADSFDIINDSQDVFNTSLFNFSIQVDGGIKETLKTVADNKTETQYQYARTISKRLKNTEIIVNKQEQYIEQLVSDMYEDNGVIHENFTNIHQDINNVVTTVQNTGGNNIIKNSVMFSHDNDDIANWKIIKGNKNLYEIKNWRAFYMTEVYDPNNFNSEIIDNSVKLTYSSFKYYNLASQVIELEPNTEYTLSFKYNMIQGEGEIRKWLYLLDENDVTVSSAQINDIIDGAYTITFTTNDSGKIFFSLYPFNTGTFPQVIIVSEIQIEKGSLKTSYIPHIESKLLIQSDTEALNNGGLSGHSFTLLGTKTIQRVIVKCDSENITENEKIYYTFSTKIKKDITGNCYVKLSNSKEEHIIQLSEGDSSFYGEYEIKELLPKDNYYDIEFYGSIDSNATFTDNMFAIGKYKTPWTQASGEIMNTQVNINVEGILVKSSVYLGDYTVMSPLEFAGYSNINGTVTKVFSLNKDVTSVKKLEAEDEIKMTPIKIVPITTGNVTGWAFVPTE